MVQKQRFMARSLPDQFNPMALSQIDYLFLAIRLGVQNIMVQECESKGVRHVICLPTVRAVWTSLELLLDNRREDA